MTLSPNARATSVQSQLFTNQLWETVAFIAKAVFMLGLTPWMIRVWGARGYGEFALASSAVVLVSILDLGIRARTRLVLCHPLTPNRRTDRDRLGEGIATLGSVAIVATMTVYLLTWMGFFDRAFRISPLNHHLLLTTAVLALLVLASGLFIEPLVALGKMGRTKLATGLGWVVAIPGVALVLYRQGTVTLAVSVWLLSLLGANLITILLSGRELHRFYPGWSGLSLSGFRTVVGEGFWFNASNTSWLVRTYGTTVLISALYGPATAGLFFILLRLSEVISALGAISSDLLLGGLAHASTIDERRDTFASAYSWAVLLCAHIALIVGFVAPEFCRLWLRPTAGMSPLAGFVIAGLGFGSAFNRIATYSAMALGLGRTAARWGFIEALTFVSLLFLAPASIFSLYGRLGLASVAAFTLWPIALGVSRELELPTTTAWLRPMWSVAPFLAASAAVLTLAWFSDHLAVKAAAIGISGVIGLINMFRRKPTRLNVSNGVIGSAAASQIPC